MRRGRHAEQEWWLARQCEVQATAQPYIAATRRGDYGLQAHLFGGHPVEDGVLPHNRGLRGDQLVEQRVRQDGRQLKHLHSFEDTP